MRATFAAARVGPPPEIRSIWKREWYFPDSLGRLYGAVTELLGFSARADEHKVQWLSASGDDRYATAFREIVSEAARLDSAYFDGHRLAAGGFSAKFFDALGLADGAAIPPVLAPSIARGLQKTVEETVLTLAGEGENLCLSRWRIIFQRAARRVRGAQRPLEERIRAGGSRATRNRSGRGLSCQWHQLKKRPRHAGTGTLLLGPSYGVDEIKQVLENCKLGFSYLRSTDDVLARGREHAERS